MQRKMPFRPRAEQIAQAYNDGFVDIFSCEDIAKPGYQPKLKATHVLRLNYAKQFLGINRIYKSRQDHAEIKKIVRVPKCPVSVFQLARDYTGMWYRVDLVQEPENVFPASLDMSLVAVTAEVEVQNEPEY